MPIKIDKEQVEVASDIPYVVVEHQAESFSEHHPTEKPVAEEIPQNETDRDPPPVTQPEDITWGEAMFAHWLS